MITLDRSLQNMRYIITLIVLIWIFQTSGFAQEANSCASFEGLVKATYNFKPSQLTASERSSKSDAMDQFWANVKANPKQLLPCLRAAIQDSSSDKWFRFDCSNLLVTLDPSPTSKAIQVQCYTQANLDDVALQLWVTVLAQRGLEDFDVSEAGNYWLKYPKAKYFIPEHAYEVKTFQGALFIFGSMDESMATPALAKIVFQRDHPGREQALEILMAQATEESLQILRQVDANTFSKQIQRELEEVLKGTNLLKARPKPKSSRDEIMQAFQEILNGNPKRFQELVSKVPDGEKDVVAVLKIEDLPIVRKVRRKIIASGNPHAIDYYSDFTKILMTFIWKSELIK